LAAAFVILSLIGRRFCNLIPDWSGRLQDCVLPDCFCSFDGTQVPGGLEVSQVPQMITITFNGAVNVDNIEVYQDVFKASFVYFMRRLDQVIFVLI
jgi:hypothetical protein